MLNHTKYSDLTSEQYELLGRAFVEWSNIEFLLGVLLSRLLFTPEFLGRTYSDEMTAVGLESAIRNALEIHRNRYRGSMISSALDEKIKALMATASTCRVRRNRFAHFLWMRRNDAEIFGAKMSGRLPSTNRNGESMIVSLEELKDNHVIANRLVEDLMSLIKVLPKIEEQRNLEPTRS